MPIVTIPDDEQEIEKPNLVINPTPYETQVVDTRKEGYDTVATFLSGSKWPCDYYSQIQGRDSAAASFQTDLPYAYGQYRLIRGFELVLTSPLQHQQIDGDQRGFTSVGQATVYSVVTPNNGDVFIADIGNGQNGLFQVTSTTRNTIFTESGTQINFRLTQVVDDATSRELNKRVIETLFFDKEYFRNGIKPLIHQETVDIIRELNGSYRRLIHLYLKDFYSDRYKTLLVPNQVGDTYDPFLTSFVKAILDSSLHPKVIYITKLGVGHDVFSNQNTLLDAILTKDDSLLISVARKMGISPIQAYRARPTMNSIYYSGIDQVVSVIDATWDVNVENNQEHAVLAFEPGDVRQDNMDSILPNLDLTQIEPTPYITPLIHPVTIDDDYILSKAFYDDTEGKSILERLMLERLKGSSIDLKDLMTLAKEAPKFNNLERFYYIPLILTLIKLAPGVI